ncbi:uncharacterized protein DUF262 [Microterricola gilva]|uniref:Uncharacterized protein DUF262 n=1 Tax=Microterricola gilva TaxID=393267 RepID=A0A4Q8AN36_9MICO|nr:DUF262 domain-containing protein [Microterricola gilva]RZU66032.1 uncharacterized protein DUF262 [Microterricola gilva]
MSTSTRAQDRTLKDWFSQIEGGRIVLPSFQRAEAWDRGRVMSMLDTVIRDLPLGVALVLEVGDEERFVSRPLVTAPNLDVKPNEHLLDGQQRLTALWRAFNNNYEDVTFFVHVPQLDADPSNDDEELGVRLVTRWTKNGRRMPLWVDDPRQCLERGLIPVQLLRPDASGESIAWAEAATAHLAPGDDVTELSEFRQLQGEHVARRDELKDVYLQPLRGIVSNYNIPYLLLKAATPKHVALDVFIKMNTNSKPLSTYDVIVAEVENATGELLHDKLVDLGRRVDGISRYGNVGDLVLQASALLQGKVPNARGELDMDMAEMITNWDKLERGLRRTVSLLEDAHIYDAKRLPTAAPLPVIAALYVLIPDYGDEVANAEKVLRSYLWSSFFTSRYENSVASRAYSDFKALAEALEASAGGRSTFDGSGVAVLDRTLFPLPTAEQLRSAGWPASKRVLARAILAASLKFGAEDFADSRTITAETVLHREYHHLFPDKLLEDAGIDSDLALNCALITWRTNRTIGRLDPVRYLEARADGAIGNASEISRRLATHMVPYAELAAAGPYGHLEGEALREAVGSDLNVFLDERVKLVGGAMLLLCAGDRPSLDQVREPAIAGNQLFAQ